MDTSGAASNRAQYGAAMFDPDEYQTQRDIEVAAYKAEMARRNRNPPPRPPGQPTPKEKREAVVNDPRLPRREKSETRS